MKSIAPLMGKSVNPILAPDRRLPQGPHFLYRSRREKTTDPISRSSKYNTLSGQSASQAHVSPTTELHHLHPNDRSRMTNPRHGSISSIPPLYPNSLSANSFRISCSIFMHRSSFV